MPSFDRDLTDPAPEALARAMVEAVETANKRCRIGKMSPAPADYRRFIADEFAGKPEGVQLWLADVGPTATYPVGIRATLLGLAWWTNPLGRRLVRVAGRRIEPGNERPQNRFGPPGQQWPALCHLDPDHVVLRTLAGRKSELIAVCGCGAVGSPAELGWMGGSCGPCHDHREEHGKPLGDLPVVLRAEGSVHHLAFSPSGRMVATAGLQLHERHGPPGKVCFWERATGKLRKEYAHDFYMGGLGVPFAARGTLCVADGYESASVWDVETGKVINDDPISARLSSLALAPDGRTLAGVTSGPILSRDLQADTPWNERWPDAEGYDGALAFSPDGKLLAAGTARGRVELIDWSTGKAKPLPLHRDDLDEQRIEALAFSPDGSLLAAGSGPGLPGSEMEFELLFGPREETCAVHLYDVKKAALLTGFEVAGAVCDVAFSPDGQLLLHAGADGMVHVVDVASRKERAVLAGHVGTVLSLAFSPDGDTLATGGGDGVVRFWPWRQLLDRPSTRSKR